MLTEEMEDTMFFTNGKKTIMTPQLCKECSPKFDKMLDKFNKEIRDFLKEGKN